jgi:hypothetical protein
MGNVKASIGPVHLSIAQINGRQHSAQCRNDPLARRQRRAALRLTSAALLTAMAAVAAQADDYPGRAGETCDWLRLLAVAEFDRVKTAPKGEALDRPS